ncbi:MAG: helix-turn-helix domain-containing protein [Planctomycetia bacterium]|nr:helix-turn-helix domain-containing protein [Planctomycetia bacterium]
MKMKLIKTEAEYEEALEAINEFLPIGEENLSEEQLDDLELLSTLVEKYEAEHFPIPFPDPIEAIKFRMEQEGLTRKELQKYIGCPSKVSEILNRKRPLSLSMIRALHEGLGIPVEVLLQKASKELTFA